MANAPDRFSLFILQPGERRIEVQEDMRIPHAATFVFNKEDHTLGNMLRHAVLTLPAVLFCGYKVPHPLEPRVLVKIQTDGSISPSEALQQACTKLIVQIGSLKQNWAKEVQLNSDSSGVMPGTGAGAGIWGAPYPPPGAGPPADGAEPSQADPYASGADRNVGGAIGAYVDI